MDKATWNTVLVVAPALILIASLGALAQARPRRQVLVPFLASLVVSIVIYVTTVGGASRFHTAVVTCGLLALGLAFLLIWLKPERNRLATISWALLGVVIPYVLFFALLTWACWGQTECFG